MQYTKDKNQVGGILALIERVGNKILILPSCLLVPL